VILVAAFLRALVVLLVVSVVAAVAVERRGRGRAGCDRRRVSLQLL